MSTAQIADCGHETVPEGIGTGYARDTDGRTLCYPCADALQRAEISDPTVTGIVAYIASDGRAIETWTGGTLARVVAYREYPDRSSGVGPRFYVQTIGPDGRRWWGRGNGGSGCAVTLHAYRTKR